MKENQQEEIRRLRLAGRSYTQISELLGLSRNTVKSVCQRNDFHPSEEVGTTAELAHCKNCGISIPYVTGRKRRRFCSIACRRAWWSAHRNLGVKKTMVSFKCAFCGRIYEDYPNNSRKYCCHACYIQDRFGKGILHDERAI